MIINVFEASDMDEYTKDVGKVFPNSVFIAPEWIERFRTSCRIPIYLRFVFEEKTVGLIAGLRLKSSNRLLRKLYKPIFFFSGPSVVQTDRSFVSMCIKALAKFACHQGYSRLLFYSWDYPQCYDLTNYPIFANIRKEFIVDLRADGKDIFKRIRPYIKRNAKRSIHIGATFHESHSTDLVTKLLFLLEETKKARLAKGHADYSHYYMPFLEDKIILEMVKRRVAKIFYVMRNSEVLSAELVVTHSKRAYAMLNATSPEGYKIGANPFLKLNLIERMKQNGFEYLNLGGIPGNAAGAALAFYKSSCGARDFVCMGGTTKFLNGFISYFNPMLAAYEKFDRRRVKRLVGSRITDKVRLAKKDLGW